MTKTLSLLLIMGLLGSSFGLTRVNAQTTNTNSGSRPVLIPNSKPYTTEGLKNATGRAGSANITVRALMAKDNSTDVEVSTADLDRGTNAPGQLTKVQLKTFSQNDEVVYTKNYNNLTAGGYFRTTLTDVQRGQPLQIQTNVRGIDANRTGVVTVLDNVKLRPDLKADRLTAPSEAAVNSLVDITATVREMNNDVGATAACVLYVDGTAVDRAAGITVGKGDAVSCAFTQRFATTGIKRLRVSIEDVTPGDYDTANNSATADVQIVNPEPLLNYDAYAREGSYGSFYRNEFHWRGSNGTYTEQGDNGSGDYQMHSKEQIIVLNAWINKPTFFPINMSAKEIAGDGTIFNLISVSSINPDYESFYTVGTTDGSFTYKQQSAVRYYNGGYLSFYTNGPLDPQNAPLPGITQFHYHRFEGKVTYYSSGFGYYWNSQQGVVYNYSYNNSQVQGSEFTTSWGNQVKLESSFGAVNDSTVYAINPVINLTPIVFSYHDPFTCTEYSYINGNETWFQKYCYESFSRGEIKEGYVFYYPQP